MPSPLSFSGLTTFQPRWVSQLKSRADSDSDAIGVALVVSASPYGLAGPIGSACESTSTTVLVRPSMSMSSRATRKCWWYGA